MALNPVTAQIIKRCQGSASFFIDSFGKVQHPKAGAIPFRLFGYQKQCLKEFRQNRWTIFRKVRQCLVEGTLIYTNNGPTPIENLKTGDSIYAYDNSKVVLDTVSEHYDSQKKECLLIETETQAIECSLDHKFLVNGEWVKASDLIAGKSELTIPNVPFGELSDNAAPLIGWLLSDGCTKIYSRCGKPYFANSSIEYINQFIKDAKAYFGDSVSLIVKNVSSKWQKKQGYRVLIQHKPGLEFVTKYELNVSKKNRRLPSCVFSWNKNSISLLLNRLYAGDGWISSTGGTSKSSNQIGYGTQSKVMAAQIVQLLSMYGIHTKYKLCKDGLYRIRFSRRDYVKIFVNEIGIFGKKIKKPINENFVRRQSIGLVKKISSIGIKHTYDITVKNAHNMISNGIVTHNSGISTLCGAYALWYAMFFPNKNVLIVSKRDEDAMGFLRRNVKFFYNELPQWMRDLWPLQDAKGLPLDNEHMIGFPNGSRITSLTSSPNTLRGNPSSLNIIDEAAFIQDMETMWAGAAPTLSHGGSVIVISTSNGIGNWYEQTYTDSTENKNSFHPIVINWWDMDWEIKFVDELTGKQTVIAPTLGIRECKTADEKKKYGPYWSPWLEEQYKSLVKKGGESLFRQEILADFLGSGNTVLTRDALLYIGTTTSDDYKPIDRVSYVSPVTGEQVVLEFNGALWLWKHTESDNFAPIKNFQYVMGVDPSTGEGSDPCGIVVWCINTLEQVAEFNAKVVPSTLAHMVDYIGRSYNNALIVPERTGIGAALCQDLERKLCYPNLYRQEMATAKMMRYGKIGYPTTGNSKPALNKALLDHLVPDQEWSMNDPKADAGCFKVRSNRLKKELEIYVNLTGNKTGAEPGAGNHDDLVIAAALGLMGINQSIAHSGSTLTPYNDTSAGGISNTSATGPQMKLPGLQDITTQAMIPVMSGRDNMSASTPENDVKNFIMQLGGVFSDSDLREKLPQVKQKKHNLKR